MQLPVDSQYTHSLHHQNDPEGASISFGGRRADKDMVNLVVGVAIFWLFSLIILLKPPVTLPLFSLFRTDVYRPVYVKSSWELIDLLKSRGLWELSTDTEVPPVLVAQYPDDLNLLDVKMKKQAFLHTLLPIVILAQSEVEQERGFLLEISKKIGDRRFDVRALEQKSYLHKILSRSEKFFLRTLSKKYRTTRLSELLVRVDSVPNSLVLAQAAIESSWGDSRFVNEGNNLFGIWTWGKYGIIPARREEGKNHKVAAFESILESVRSYILMLNRVSAYGRLRRIRQHTHDSLVLADGLLYYSERRDEYVNDVKRVIEVNELQKYDNFVLADDKQNREAKAPFLAEM